MMKYLRILVLSMAVVGLMTGSAFAASLDAGNTTVASELVPAGGLAVPGGVNTAYQTTGPVAPTTQIKVSLTNGTFTGASLVDFCDSLGGSYLAAPVAVPVAPNNTSVTLVLTGALASGTVYNLQPAACIAGPVPLNNVNIAAGGGGTQVAMTIDNALVPGDPNIFATNVVTRLVDQFSIELTPVVDTISFAAAMKQFLGFVPTSTNNFNIISDETIGTLIPTGATNTTCAAMAPGAEVFKYTATPGAGYDFSGITAATGFSYSIAGGVPVVIDAAIAAADASATGNVATVGFMVCGAATPAATKALPANLNQLILTVNGTTVLTPRTYDILLETTTAGLIAAGPRTLLAKTLGWTWKLDSAQFYIPLVGSNLPDRETYIKLQSKNQTANANGVSVAILANDGTTVATYNPGAIVPGTPLTITGEQLVNAATAAGKTVDGAAGFAAIVTVNAPEADVFCYANMIDAAGAKRIPVKTVGGAIVE